MHRRLMKNDWEMTGKKKENIKKISIPANNPYTSAVQRTVLTCVIFIFRNYNHIAMWANHTDFFFV